ncbi:hypothetical protein [Pyramidobacter sp.]|uniref:hypothetical protein n=1 Tax=Pyramidobacter sp. TaxID=1943581 RepID=UPI002A839130|nr:hypothetical protein [Pyramidobacter sp.]
MNHEIFSGTHYNIGRQWGQKLAQRNVSLLSQIPFPLSEEAGNFASACLPVYQKFFPALRRILPRTRPASYRWKTASIASVLPSASRRFGRAAESRE